MADENTNIQQPGEEVTPENLGVTFEDILPWGSEGGDTGLSARLKLKRNFEKIKMWFDSTSITRLKELFLSKIEDDQANGMITFIKGLQVGDRFVTGLLGEGGVFRKEADGTTYLEADKLYIRIKAYFDNVEIRDFKHSAGNRIASPAGMKCCRVEWLDAGGDVVSQTDANLPQVVKFRCYFRGDDGEDEVRNNFIVGDQAYCHITSVDTKADDPNSKGLNMKHYWRLVVGRNPSGTLTADGEHWIDLSNRSSETLKIDGRTYTHAGCQDGSDIPMTQDDIIQLGNIYDTDRMGAIIEFVTGADSPSYQIFQDINDYDLNGKNYIALGYSTQTGRAYLNVYGDTFIGDPKESTYIRYNAQTKKLDVKATVTFVSPTTHEDTTIEDFAAAVTSDINTIQDQIDGTIETWFYNGVPGDSTLPESQWKAIDEAAGNNNERLKHLGDMYYDNQTGYAYRYANQGTESQPQFVWTPISDSAVVKALADAAKAQDTADHKRRVFLTTPTPPYDNGDLWVNAVWPASGASKGSIYNDDILRCLTSKNSTQQFNINDWVKASKYTDDSALNDFVTNTYAGDLADIQTQVDGKAETFYQDTDPSTNWSTEDKPSHVGDIWYDTNANRGKKTYIWRDRGEGQSNRFYWAEQAVPSVVFDEIDGKAAIYITWGAWIKGGVSNLNEKDLFVPAADTTQDSVTYKKDKVYRCTDASIPEFEEIQYTDDSGLQNFINNTYNVKIVDLEKQIDSKAETWYQNTNPASASGWVAADHVGDLWYCTADIAGTDYKKGTTWFYKKTGTDTYAWVKQDVPKEVFDKIDGKSAIFTNTTSNPPTGYKKNDLWILPADATINGVSYKQGEVLTATKDHASAYNASDWTKKVRYTDNSEFNNFVDTTYSADKENLQNQIDGKYETWFYEGVPTLNNAPASSWTSAKLKKNHLGDLYWDKTNKHAYRFVVNGSEYSWQQIGDEGVIAAMAQAADAQDTADNKRRVFVGTPTTPYDVGDLWTQGKQGDIFKCKTARATGSYSASDWELASKYTDDSSLLTFLDGYNGSLGEAIKEQVDKKAETWVSSSNPATAWNTTALKDEHVGDMWLNTSNASVAGVGSMKTAIYTKSGSSYSWVVDNTIPNSVFDTIDGKKAIYVTWATITTAMANGKLQVRDLFIPSSNTTQDGKTYTKNKVYRCTAVGAYSDGAITTYPTFVEIAYTDDSSLNSFLNTVYGTTVLDTIKAQNDKKAETWYQDEDPSSQWTTTAMKDLHVGDIWHNANTSAIGGVDAGCDAIYTKSGSTYSWRMSDVPQGVYDTIDGKADIFVTKPTTYNVNDMWIIENGLTSTDMPTGCKSGDIVISSATRKNAYTKADWQKKDRYTDDSALNTFKADQYVTQLTNGTITTNIANAQSAAQAAEAHAATLDYVKTALKQDTVIEGGLVISTLLALRDGNNNIWSGINGAYKSAETGTDYKGHGIAAWYGGAMVDKEVTTTAIDYAKSLFRFDGSGYVAGGNLSWDKSGNVTIQGYSINATTLKSNGSAVATEGMLANYLPLSAGSSKKLTGTLYAQTVISKTNSTYNLGTSDYYWNYLYVKRIYLADDVWLEYDSTNTSVKLNGSLYATGGVSALGAGSGGSSGGGDVTWALLASSSDKRQIALSHLTTALSSYATQDWVTQQISASATGGTVTAVKVGTTTYNPSNGLVSLPAYLPLVGGSSYSLSGYLYMKNDSYDYRIYDYDNDNGSRWLLRHRHTKNADTGIVSSILSLNNSVSVTTADSPAGTNGAAYIVIGNGTGAANANSKYGYLRMYGRSDTDATSAFYCSLIPSVLTGNRTFTLPDNGGTIALTSDIASEMTNVVTLGTAQTISGAKTFSAQQAFTVAQGTSPFTVASNTVVSNLNADLLDGQHGSYYATASSVTTISDYFSDGVANKAAADSNGRSLVTYKEYSDTFPQNDGTLQWYTLLTYTNNYYSKSAIVEISTRRATAIILINFYNQNSPYITFIGYYGNPIATAGGFTGGVRVIADGSNANIQFQFYASSSTTASYRWLGVKVYSENPANWVLVDSLVADTATYESFLADVKATSGCLTGGGLMPTANNNYDIGSSSFVYKNVYATTFHGALSGNADSATKLQTSRTIWGQTFDGTANVSGAITGATTITASSNVSVGGTLGVTGNTTISGTLTVSKATTLSSTLGVTGLLTASGGITIPSGKTLTIGDAVLSWDSTNQGIKITKGLYSETFISALGIGSSSGTATTLATLADVNVTGAKNDDVLTYNSTTRKWEAKAVQTGTDMATVWTELGASTTNQINASHLTNALGSYAQKTELTKYFPLTAGTGNRITGYTYISRPVSTATEYTETDSRIYYTTPDSIDEILIRARIRNNGTNNYYRTYSISPFSSITSNDVVAGTQGYTTLSLGNTTLISAANSRCGRIILYGRSDTNSTKVYYGNITPTVFTANRTYNLPDATGTIALTSNLDGYLPLTGGTLTGKLTINHSLEVSSASTFRSGFHIGNPNGRETQLYTADNMDSLIIKPIVSGSSDLFQLTKRSNGLSLDFSVHDSSGNPIGGLNMLQLSNASNWNIAYGSLSTTTGSTFINGHRVVIRTSSSTEEVAVENDGTVNIAGTVNIVGNVSAAKFIGALQGNADSATTASKLSVVSKRAWGQTYWTSGGVPTNISGDMTGVGLISMSGSISGATTISATTISASTSLSVGDIIIEKNDEINNYDGGVHLQYSTTGNVSLCRGPYSGNGYNGGNVAIGHANPSYKLDVMGVIYSSAGVYSAGYVTALSDIRKKEIKGDVGLTVEDVANAPSVKFLWKDKRKDGMQVGSIAQYWQKVLPEAVIDDSDGVLSMSYGVIALLASIATARKVQDHERRISELERENKQLKRQLEDKCQ